MSYSEEKIKNVNELYDILIENNVKDRKTKKEHIKNIKTNVDKKDISKCPKCGGTLVERESIYGKFIGCSNYPQCKYTRKINSTYVFTYVLLIFLRKNKL